ncbi:vacuolar type H+-transporting ATPase subunit I [Candidatus Termititenax aidoneus]|uniref:Vacuolar type H+-transporting ATPase subunit I n=1 Tax=Termititenax aidoneus TaxID=2218524 RepID=A0A388T9N4_TERA1|nr:vacuolar type H+-transporting ATPase subunit I [Candidatus Termititenax aidoneus]
MSVAGLQKVQIFILQKKTPEFLAGLQELGVLEITNLQDSAPPPAAELAQRYQKILRFLGELFPRPRGFIENFIQVKPVVKKAQAAEILKNNSGQTIALLEKLSTEWRAQTAALKQLADAAQKQELYACFGLARAKKAAKLKQAGALFGQIPVKKLDAEKMQVLRSDEKTAFVQIIFLREDETAVRVELAESGFTEVTLPLQKREYFREAVSLRWRFNKLSRKNAELRQRLAKIYAAEYTRLAVWTEHLTQANALRQWSAGLAATEKTSFLTGWIPLAQKKKLRQYLEKFSGDLYWREVEPDEGEEPPILLRNGAATPLEAVTALYGMPNNKDLDPSPFMAPFFIVFYGLCLSDAGYGLLLLLFAVFLLARFFANLTKFGKKLLVLNIYCGLSTIVVGLLTGSVFGLDFNILPWPAVKNFFWSVKIIDPMANPLPLLGLSVALGAVQMLTGLFLRWILDIRQKGFGEAFLVSGCWFVFLLAIFGWAVLSLLPAGRSWSPAAALLAGILQYIVMGGAVFMILTQGRHQKSPLLKLGSGLLSLYRLSGYVGDLLSYTRLFALGLVTAVMALVINYLAALTGGIPVIGLGVMIVILIFGHVLDFLINMLGSFVHSARLQYVEYFSKFFEGGGRFFQPFSWQTKYVSLE